MKAQGLRTAMLTGDGQASADAVAQSVGIDEVHARLLPQDKLAALNEIREKNGAVMFVGDGINDAPVLAGADVGAAMGSGADAAIEAAGCGVHEGRPVPRSRPRSKLRSADIISKRKILSSRWQSNCSSWCSALPTTPPCGWRCSQIPASRCCAYSIRSACCTKSSTDKQNHTAFLLFYYRQNSCSAGKCILTPQNTDVRKFPCGNFLPLKVKNRGTRPPDLLSLIFSRLEAYGLEFAKQILLNKRHVDGVPFAPIGAISCRTAFGKQDSAQQSDA